MSKIKSYENYSKKYFEIIFICLGFTIVAIAFANTRNSFDVSSPPSRPDVYDIDYDGCFVSFDKPVWDGGTPITKYIIQGMDRLTGRWVQKNTTVYLKCDISGVAEGSQWKFHVRALNAAGVSDPSVDSDLVTFKKRYR